jgi:hypothetical protein
MDVLRRWTIHHTSGTQTHTLQVLNALVDGPPIPVLDGPVEVVPASELRGAVEDLRTFAQAVLDLPCAFGREGDPLAAQQRRAADLINAYRGQ